MSHLYSNIKKENFCRFCDKEKYFDFISRIRFICFRKIPEKSCFFRWNCPLYLWKTLCKPWKTSEMTDFSTVKNFFIKVH